MKDEREGAVCVFTGGRDADNIPARLPLPPFPSPHTFPSSIPSLLPQGLELYLFRALPSSRKVDIRLDKMDDLYGSPSIDDIEAFQRGLFAGEAGRQGGREGGRGVEGCGGGMWPRGVLYKAEGCAKEGGAILALAGGRV